MVVPPADAGVAQGGPFRTPITNINDGRRRSRRELGAISAPDGVLRNVHTKVVAVDLKNVAAGGAGHRGAGHLVQGSRNYSRNDGPCIGHKHRGLCLGRHFVKLGGPNVAKLQLLRACEAH